MINLERLKSKSFEVSNNKSYIDFTYILATADIPNMNGALFTKSELEKSVDTIKNEPLIIVGEEPSGHDIINFPALGEGKVIGTHIDSWLGDDEQGISHLYAKARVWKIRYESIVGNMLKLHQENNLQFSMECSYDKTEEVGSARSLLGVNFIGSATVDTGANVWSTSLEVANKQKGEIELDLEKAKLKIAELESELEQFKDVNVASLKEKASSYDGLKAEKDILEKSVATANKKVDTLDAELSELKTEKANQELKEKQEERFNEIAQYVNFEEAEVAEKKEQYGKMDEATWDAVLSIAQKNRKQEDNSTNHSFASDTSIDIQKGFLDGLGE